MSSFDLFVIQQHKKSTISKLRLFSVEEQTLKNHIFLQSGTVRDHTRPWRHSPIKHTTKKKIH